jgi:hypothetical protein
MGISRFVSNCRLRSVFRSTVQAAGKRYRDCAAAREIILLFSWELPAIGRSSTTLEFSLQRAMGDRKVKLPGPQHEGSSRLPREI